MIVAWTGHRPELFRDPFAARDAVQATAREMTVRSGTRFLVGGQRGVDTWAALHAIDTGIAYRLVLPFDVPIFTEDWSEADRSVLIRTMAQAEAVQIAGGYAERNQVLAEESDLLVVVWTRTSGGGTAETLNLARRAGTPIREVILAPSPAAYSARGRGI